MKIILHVLFLLFVLSACNELLLPESPENDPVTNFELLWEDFDHLYGGFEAKNIDWDALYDAYAPMVTAESSDKELYDAITGMLRELNDNHVFLFPTNPSLKSFNSGVIGERKTFNDFKLSVVKENYLTGIRRHNGSITSGLIGTDIGYIHFSNINESLGTYKDIMKSLLDRFKDTKGLIIDVRANEGGNDKSSVFIAGHFTESRKLAFKFRIKNGPRHDDFDVWREFYVEPETGHPYTKPVIVLTHRFTISAGETFVWSMDQLNQVTIVGDTTSGAFSDVVRRELPNGWAYGVAVGQWLDAEGRSFEGIGFPPDILIENQETDLLNGADEALEVAIDLIK